MVEDNYGYLTYTSIRQLVPMTDALASINTIMASFPNDIALAVGEVSSILTVFDISMGGQLQQVGSAILVAADSTISAIQDAANSILTSLANPTALNNPTEVPENNAIWDNLKNQNTYLNDQMKAGFQGLKDLFDINISHIFPNPDQFSNIGDIGNTNLSLDYKRVPPSENGWAGDKLQSLMGKGVGTLGKNMPSAMAGLGASGIAGSLGAAVAGIGAMVPQMIALAIVTQPIQAFLQGVMEPFSMLSEIFGAFGEVLGVMFIPILNMIMPILLPFIPIFMDLAKILAPLIVLYLQFCTPLGYMLPLLQLLTPVLSLVVGVLGGVGETISTVLTPALNTAYAFVGFLGNSLVALFGVFTNSGDVIANLTNLWTGFVNNVQNLFMGIGDSIAGLWNNLGTRLTGGGLDGSGWW